MEPSTTKPSDLELLGAAPIPDPIESGASPRRQGRARIAVLGNCQMGHMARCLQALIGGEMPTRAWVTHEMLADWQSGKANLEDFFGGHDKVFLQPWIWEAVRDHYPQLRERVVLYPSIGFMAYHPDLVPIQLKDSAAPFDDGPTIRCNSSIAFLGWKAGLSAGETIALFRAEVFERLGFFDYWDSSVAALLEEGRKAELPLDDLLAQWHARGCFMYCHLHPKLEVIADLARLLLRRNGIPMVPGNPIQYVDDYLANGVIWPVYPEIGAALGVEGLYQFKLATDAYQPDGPVHLLGLEDYVERCFAAFNKHRGSELIMQRLDLPAYQSLMAELRARKAAQVMASAASAAPAPAMAHPYRGLPPERFWRSAIEKVATESVDPVVRARFHLETGTAVATAGSCFAQHIARHLAQRGLHFLRTESAPPGLSAEQAEQRHFGLFPARFGNVYTARQLLQLVERAYGERVPVERAWLREDGRHVDPFRPQIEPEGYASLEALEADREAHLAAVRRMFDTLDIFVFTLGLTEAWRSRTDDSVYPIAPGVAGGEMDPVRHEFVNFTLAEVDADLERFIARLAVINPRARVILTVSPVPLAATFEERHVLTATTYSKSVLRVAAEQIVRRHTHVDYFPSYEVITGNFSRGRYYESDLRSVTASGVDHVMRLFFRHYALQPEQVASTATTGEDARLAEARQNLRVLCDEELLAAAAR